MVRNLGSLGMLTWVQILLLLFTSYVMLQKLFVLHPISFMFSFV